MRIGLWWIHPYTLKVALGSLFALFVLWWRAPRFKLSRHRLFMWMWFFAVVAILGGRLGYVVGNTPFFVEHPAAIFQLDQIGGLHGGSALASVLCVAWFWARRTSVRLRAVLDFLAPAVLCIAASAWWGCAGVGCAWGQEVFAASAWQRWIVAELPDIYRAIEPRYVVQRIGAIWALVLACVAGMRGEWGRIALMAYLLGAAGLTFLRADPVPQFGTLRSDLMLDMALAGTVFAAILLDVRPSDGTKPGKL